jgi:hypothetical protein
MQFKPFKDFKESLCDSAHGATRCRQVVRSEALPKHQKEVDVVVIGAGT